MKYIIEIEKYQNKDYTLRIYEGNNIFVPVLIIRSPKHWNKILTAIGLFLTSKKFINIFQEKATNQKLRAFDEPCKNDGFCPVTTKLKEDDTKC